MLDYRQLYNRFASLFLYLGASWIFLSRAWSLALEQYGLFFVQNQIIDAAGRFIRLLPLIIFWLIISILWGVKLLSKSVSISQARQAVPPNSGPALTWVFGFSLAFALIAGTIIYADPSGLYGTKIYQPLNLSLRDEKAMGYLVFSPPPDIVILGSSRAFTVSPKYIQATLGYSGYNASTTAGTSLDSLIMTRFMFDHTPRNPPSVLLVYLDPGITVYESYTVYYTPLYLLQYADKMTAVAGIQVRINGLLDPKQVTDSIYSIRYTQLVGGPADVNWKFDSVDGQGVSTAFQDLEVELKGNIEGAKPVFASNPACDKSQPCALSADGARYTEELIALARQHNTAVVFYTIPIHPMYYIAIFKENHVFQAGSLALADYMDNLRSRYDNVYFLDYSSLESFDGLDTAAGWYDGAHMTAENNNRVIKAAAGTLRQAYQWAEIKRRSNTTGK